MAQTPPRPARRWRRWLAALVVIAGVMLLAVWIAIESAWVEERIRQVIVERANDTLAAELDVGALSGSLLGGDLTLDRVRLMLDDQPVLTADAIHVRYDPRVLIRQGLVFNVTLQKPEIHIRQTDQGWNVARLTRPRTGPGGGRAVYIPNLDLVDATIEVDPLEGDPRRLTRVQVNSSLEVGDGRVEVVLDRLTGLDPATGLHLEHLEGTLAVEDGRVAVSGIELRTPDSRVTGEVAVPPDGHGPIAFAIATGPLVLSDVRRYTSVLPGFPADLSVTLDATGSTDDFSATWQARSGAGNAKGTVQGRVSDAGSRLTGAVDAAGFVPEAWFPDLDPIDKLDLTSTFTVTAPTARFADPAVEFDARSPHVRAAGYTASGVRARGRFADGRVTFAASGTAYGSGVTSTGSFTIATRHLDTSGRFARVDLRALPETLSVPEIESDLAGMYALRGAPGDWHVEAQFDASTIAGARLSEGGTARVDLTGDDVAYAARMALQGVDLPRAVAFLPEPNPRIAELTGLVNARLDVAASGTSLETLAGTASLVLTDSTVDGVRLSTLTAQGALTDHALRATLTGRLDGDVGKAARVGDAGQYVAAGDITADVAIPDVRRDLALDDVSGQAQVTLQRASIRGVTLDRVSLTAGLADGRVTVGALEAAGPNLEATAKGLVALGDSGRSDLDYQIDVTDLSILSDLVDQPLGGSVRLIGQITGPSGTPTTTGKLQATSITTETANALSLDGTYSATMPDLDVERVSADLDLVAELVTVGDQEVNRVEATIGYARDAVDIDASVQQGSRTLNVESRLVPHPDHREVHVRAATVAVGDLSWQLQGPEAVIRYGADRLEVEGLTLASGSSRLIVNGTLSEVSDTALTIEATNIDVADLRTIALSEQDISGQLNLTATLTGSFAALRATLEGRATNGAISGVAYQSIDLAGQYAANQLTIDVALEAGPSGQLAATGTMPLVLDGGEGAPRPPYDLTVRSTRVNMGLFQPAVTFLGDLAGTGEFDVRVTGEAPDVNGTITLTDVSFAVPATGQTYRALNADLSLAGERLVVRQLRVEDADGDAAVVQGTLDVPGVGPAGQMELSVVADTFDVLNNQYGELTLSADLTAMGDFQTPLMVGTINVDRGLIEVSQLLRRLQGGYDPIDTAAAADEAQTPFDRSSVSITLAMPDNIVIRGRDLRAGSGPIGLGDINVTVGGALSIAKEVGEEPQIIGRMNVVRGQYRFQGRPFTIARDSGVQFRGDPANPALDISAERTISGVLATVHVAGTPSRPEISLSSNPPLDQGDVLSLIVFNQSMNRLGSAQRVSLAARAGALAAGAIASPLADSVADALNLDVVEIQPVASGEGGASIMLGRQVNERLFVGFRHEFGDEISRLTFEYRINEFLRLVTSLAQGGSRSLTTQQAEAAGIDLVFVVR
jgi:autotransporter translocation and assembly factor TamB